MLHDGTNAETAGQLHQQPEADHQYSQSFRIAISFCRKRSSDMMLLVLFAMSETNRSEKTEKVRKFSVFYTCREIGITQRFVMLDA
jgi:hypothetical protein